MGSVIEGVFGTQTTKHDTCQLQRRKRQLVISKPWLLPLGIMDARNSHYLPLLLLSVPSLLLAFRLLVTFPLPPGPIAVYPSLASLPNNSRSWLIYPENFYEGGNYANFPFGRVSITALIQQVGFSKRPQRFGIGSLVLKMEKK